MWIDARSVQRRNNHDGPILLFYVHIFNFIRAQKMDYLNKLQFIVFFLSNQNFFISGAVNQKSRISQSPVGDVVLPPTVVGSTASDITNLANASVQSASALSPLVQFLPSLPILPLNGATSAVALDATNHQSNVLNFGAGQQQAAMANLPGRAFVDGQRTLQTSQQNFPLQPQSQPALQMVPNLGQVQPLQPLQPPQQPLQLAQQSLVSQQLSSSGQQIQKMQPQLSQFPTFPSLNQLLGIPPLPSMPSSPTIFG